MSNFALVIDENKKPLSPCHRAVARKLLQEGKAAVFLRYPYTILLKRAVEDANAEPIQLKIDPGSKVSGLALVQGDKVIWGAELTHRGQGIKNALASRRNTRRGRRGRHLRYRQPRFLNRTKPQGWLAPSLLHRVLTIQTWVRRLCRLGPIAGLSQELVRFDMQVMADPEVEGAQYQQGTLFGFEVREYLLEKWQRQCPYCKQKNVPLEIEHIEPKSRGGSHRIANLCLACHECNQAKGTVRVEEFLKDKPDVLKQILKQAKTPLKDAAAVNATRWRLFHTLKATGLPVAVGTGGRTKWNRTRFGLAKAHWLDAACVGEVERLEVKVVTPLLIKWVGHGTRQMCRTDKFGFPNKHKTRHNLHFGFQTGDMVKAVVTKGKKIGTYVGKVACRVSGSFNIATVSGLVQGISYKNCRVIHHKDGYAY